jgi:hypothetical protein
MKARYYSSRFNDDPTSETLAAIAVEFDQETAALIKQRGVKSNDSFLSLLREMDDKWQAFARRTNGVVKLDGYRIMMRKLHPDTAAFAWPNVRDHRHLPVARSVPGAQRPSTERDAGRCSVDRIVRVFLV